MIRSLCEKRQLTEATKLVTEMEGRGIAPDSRTYGLLMNGMLKANMASSCLALFESASSSIRTSSLIDNVHIYTTAITAASMMGTHDRALEIVSRMTANGVKPNIKTWTALIVGACMGGGQADLAARLYEKIESPDGYAMHQGIRAYCANGEASKAASIIETQRRGQRLMSGKEMMLSYKAILQASLGENDFELARSVFGDLLKKRYIPNKAILEIITDTFQLGRRFNSRLQDPEIDHVRFRFLLFVIDRLEHRNLPIEGLLYASTLTLGSLLGGVPRRIGALLSQAKVSTGQGSTQILPLDGVVPALSKLVNGWESAVDNFESIEPFLIENLPSLQVRTTKKEFVRILRAEQVVSFRSRRNLSKKQPVEPH